MSRFFRQARAAVVLVGALSILGFSCAAAQTLEPVGGESATAVGPAGTGATRTQQLLHTPPSAYMRLGFGMTIPTDDVVLDPFNQAAGLDGGPAGLFEIGLNWQPSNFDVRFFTGFQGGFFNADVDSFRNLLVAGSAVAASGNADFRTVLAILGIQWLIGDRWAAEASVGLGRGWLDFDLLTGGGSASASGGALAGQFGIGVERFVAKCLAIGMTAYLTRMNGISGETGTGVPFTTGSITSLALMGVLSYKLGLVPDPAGLPCR